MIKISVCFCTVYFFAFLVNDSSSLYADTNSYFGNTEEMALIIQKFKNATAYFYESWIDPSKGKFRELTLIGTNGSASLNFSEPDRFTIYQSYLEKNKKKILVL